MAPSSPTGKRKTTDDPISPPPVKRTVQSGTTKTAVANFFTPASQKPKDRTTWTERSANEDVPATLLVGHYRPEKFDERLNKRRKIAAFDLDSTLISTSSGKRHASSARDWKWWHNQVPGRLRKLYQDEGYQVVIFSNQGGLTLHFDAKFKGPKAGAQKKVDEYKQKCNAILTYLDLPITLFAATGKDNFRKPRVGMWKEMCDEYDIPEEELDLKNSFFVGDAGGRVAGLNKGANGVNAMPKDFSCSDRNLAHNIGIDFKTPEEFFLGDEPRDFAREFDLIKHPYSDTAIELQDVVFEKKNDKDIVLFCGPPGAGKSTFYWKYLKPLGYARVNQDILKSRDRCVKLASDLLQGGESVAIDNTNADPDTRAVWANVAKSAKVPIRCVWFTTPLHICEHNDAVRSLNKPLNPEDRQVLPKMAFTGFASRYKDPSAKEGFQDVTEVQFKFRGTKEEYDIWGRYWT